MSEWDTDVAPFLIVGNAPSGPGLMIGNNVPAVLVTYYQTNWNAVLSEAWIGSYVDANKYQYRVVSEAGIFTPTDGLIAEGWVIGGSVKELYINSYSSNSGSQVVYYGTTTPTHHAFSNGIITYNAASNGGIHNEVKWGVVSLPRGISVGGGIYATTVGALAGPTVGANELDVTGFFVSVDGVAGRAYMVRGALDLACTVATDIWTIRARLDSPLVGTQIAEVDGTSGSTTIAEFHFPYFPSVTQQHFIYISVLRRSGTGTFTAFGSPGPGIIRTWVSVEDISDNSEWTTL